MASRVFVTSSRWSGAVAASLLVLFTAGAHYVTSSAMAATPVAVLAVADKGGVKIEECPRAICEKQTVTLRATGNPPGGTYSWKVTRGADQVDPTTGTGATFTITGKKASPRVDDVKIEVEYKGAKAVCELTVVSIKLESITFGGLGYHVVSQDGGGPDYSAAHWFDHNGDGVTTDTAGDRRFPALYVRASRITVTRLTAVVAPKDFKRADVPVNGAAKVGHVFKGTGAIDAGKLTVTTAMVADAAVPNTIFFYDTYDVSWEVALVDKMPCGIGASDNRIYVSLDKPASPRLFESVCHLACTTATGEAALDRVVAAIGPSRTSLSTPA